MNIKEKATSIKILIHALFIALKKKETPILAKILAGITVGYGVTANRRNGIMLSPLF